ncbi:hypothetical protein [Nocardioides sp.]|uniref:hypothetical protein n=1 Tax=Nocardioides sp. TaxID=35761 RepID=UPI002EDB8F4E
MSLGLEGLREPVDRRTAALLRRAVLDHVRSERRRSFPALLHVGVPGRSAEVFAIRPDDPFDHALGADVVAVLLQRARRAGAAPLVWLTRPGPLDVEDVDVAWLAAARTASAEAGTGLTWVTVTRRGWADPRSGVRREWKRLRQR